MLNYLELYVKNINIVGKKKIWEKRKEEGFIISKLYIVNWL